MCIFYYYLLLWIDSPKSILSNIKLTYTFQISPIINDFISIYKRFTIHVIRYLKLNKSICIFGIIRAFFAAADENSAKPHLRTILTKFLLWRLFYKMCSNICYLYFT